jgi:hypothetical protein
VLPRVAVRCAPGDSAVCGNPSLLGVYGSYSEALSLTSALSQVNASVPSYCFQAFAGSTIYAELLDTNTVAPAHR